MLLLLVFVVCFVCCCRFRVCVLLQVHMFNDDKHTIVVVVSVSCLHFLYDSFAIILFRFVCSFVCYDVHMPEIALVTP